MSRRFSTDAVLLRRIEYGDHDLILTLLTRERGNIAVIAKSAKKSAKRFAGVLEPFSLLRIVCTVPRRGGGMPVLQEAAIERPLPYIREDIFRTAYASYWAELIMAWVERDQRQEALYHLMADCLSRLDHGIGDAEMLSLVFQMQFLNVAGIPPNLHHCTVCRRSVDTAPGDAFRFDVADGTMTCQECSRPASHHARMSRQAIKQMLWIQRGGLDRALRVRFQGAALTECTMLLEQFIPYHLGKTLKSLEFLTQLKAR